MNRTIMSALAYIARILAQGSGVDLDRLDGLQVILTIVKSDFLKQVQIDDNHWILS